MEKIFKPICNTIINVFAYSMLGMLFFVELNSNAFLVAGVLVSMGLIALYYFHLRKDTYTTKEQHLVFVVVTTLFMVLILVLRALTIKRSDFFLVYLSLASLSPFYNFCGYVRFAKVDENNSVLKYVAGVLLAPFVAFLFYTHYAGTNYKTLYMIVIVMAYYFVIFSLIKIVAMVAKERNLKELIFQSPIVKKRVTLFMTILIPLIGLLLNQYMYSGTSQYAIQTDETFSRDHYGFFGDFSSPVFYALTIFNGLMLIVPMINFNKLKLPIFYLRSVGYSFIVYMCLVFLPVLPIGILTLFFVVGLYAFVPFFIAWWQGKIMLEDYKLLLAQHKKKLVVSVFVLGFLTIPIAMAPYFIMDKINYQNAVTYLDTTKAENDKIVNISNLNRTLESQNVYTHPTRLYRSSIHSNYTYRNVPIVTSLYKMYIFGGQDMNWDTMNKLEALFLNDGYYDNDYNYYSNFVTNMNILDYYTSKKADVALSSMKLSTTFDESINAYRTWVDLELKNEQDSANEYTTVFGLPDGVYISDYYLYVGDEKKMGMLTDQRAAVSIYKKIVLSRLDPGILHYVGDSLLELRVFPFEMFQTRKTGFELIHTNSLDFKFNGEQIVVDVGNVATGKTVVQPKVDNAILLTYDEIKELPPINKELEYNFVVDCSQDSDTEWLLTRVRNYCQENNIWEGNLYTASYKFEKLPFDNIYSLEDQQVTNEGGFNLHLAIKNILKTTSADKIPVIIYVTEKEEKYEIIRPNKIRDYSSPESTFYYALEYDELTAFNLYNNYNIGVVQDPIIDSTVSYNGVSVINDGTDKLVVLNNAPMQITNNQYLDAMALSAQYKINQKEGVKPPVAYIRQSILSHVLTPATSFIVVETKEQEDELLEMQKRILEQQDKLEASGKNLSEPPLAILIILVSLMFAVGRTRKKA